MIQTTQCCFQTLSVEALSLQKDQFLDLTLPISKELMYALLSPGQFNESDAPLCQL